MWCPSGQQTCAGTCRVQGWDVCDGGTELHRATGTRNWHGSGVLQEGQQL